MQNGYHTAKVEWIKDKPIPEEELGNLKIITFNKYYHDIVGNRYMCIKLQYLFWEGIYATKYFSSKVKEMTLTQIL